jgi:hypothetical protein
LGRELELPISIQKHHGRRGRADVIGQAAFNDQPFGDSAQDRRVKHPARQ